MDVELIRSLDSESIRWSPDSRYLTLTEDFFVTFNDPDIWLMDTQDGTLINLTDDGPNRIDLSKDAWRNIDLLPGWTEDGKIIFVQYNRISGKVLPPDIYQITIDGGEPTLLGTLDTGDEPFAVYKLGVWHDKLIYIYFSAHELPDNGLWISDLNGENPRQIKEFSLKMPISAATISPDGNYALVRFENSDLSTEFAPEDSLVRVIEIQTGKEILIDSQHFVAGAGWSPEGSALVYFTREATGKDEGVFLTALPGKAGRQVLAGRFGMATPLQRQFLTWGANNTILLSRSPERGIVLMKLDPSP